MYLYDLIGEYTEKAKGPVRVFTYILTIVIRATWRLTGDLTEQTEELSLFCRTVIRSQLADLSKKLEDTLQRDVDSIEVTFLLRGSARVEIILSLLETGVRHQSKKVKRLVKNQTRNSDDTKR